MTNTSVKSANPAQCKIGFIGTGIMGNSMAGHLLAGGYPVQVFNRTKEKAAGLIARGAIWANSLAELAAQADVIITIIGYPRDVEETYLGPQGILANAKNGVIAIDMTTSSPALAVQIAAAGSKKGVACLDAPVSGGDVGARDAKLSIMVGGDATAFDQVLPLFQLMGNNIALLGPAGSGQNTKLCNQIVIASTIMGVCEGLSFAKKAGLDPLAVLKVIGSGAASSTQLNMLGPKMVQGDFAPGFMIEHLVKDLGISITESEQMGLNLPGLKQAKKLYDLLMTKELGRSGTQALFKVYLENLA
ncbi:NAD(P)-dependent oxidoreductase [Polynucleobacter sp. IMCC 29146]|uniref:NAD(P)-dependent oxidoreductase n=1 Tax=Polynucleobacter sp. IMCC 29146 TaxID=2780953 RepID=UPI001F2D37B4|nr:NAD(P)-dependent oxidoreductase [Polynucleobacter sp. IMCC 29146]MCE7529161.1 NAD(P)-dependent oxidoreductase [Polynucleobacter sp. IMCC 29146]